jgi:SH3-like domain-containing protein
MRASRSQADVVRTLIAVLAALVAQAAAAADFRSVADAAAVLYDAPSRAATPLWVVSHDYPLEVIVNLEAWVKVRDQTGTLSWIEKRELSDKRTVLVMTPTVEVRRKPEDLAPIAFVVGQNVVLDLIGTAPGGWLQVRHPDGATGYLRATQVWGG